MLAMDQKTYELIGSSELLILVAKRGMLRKPVTLLDERVHVYCLLPWSNCSLCLELGTYSCLGTMHLLFYLITVKWSHLDVSKMNLVN
jgi:hypothetical protein